MAKATYYEREVVQMNNKLTHWMQTIRGKLTIWYVTTFTILFSFFLLAASFIFWNILNQQVQHHLETVLDQVTAVWEQSGQEGEDIIQSLVASQGMVIMIMAPDGQILLQSTSEDITLPTQHQLQQHLAMLRNENVQLPHFFSIDSTRFVLTPTDISSSQGVIGVGFQTSLLENVFRQSLIALVSLVLVSILVVGIIGYVIVKRTLFPIQTIISTAKSISSSSDLEDRIPYHNSQNELGELTNILNSMLDRLEQSFKVQRQFLADAAHTLKTPVTVLHTQIESLDASVTTKEKLLHTLDSLHKTVQDLLYLSRLQGAIKLSTTEVDLSSLVNEVTEISETLAEDKRITVKKNVQPGIVVQGDKSLFTRALLNLLENAITYTPSKGTVSVSLTKNKTHIVVVVKDTGIGIPESEIKNVSSRFYRASNNIGSGTGLGLAITKAVVENMNGTLSITSIEGKGTTISLDFSI